MVPNAGQLAAEADRHRRLQARVAIPGIRRSSSTPNADEPCCVEIAMVLVDQLVAQAEPAIAADGIETRQQEVAGGDQFQLATLDFPLLPADFHAARERFAVDAGPIERHAGRRRLVARANQPAVRHRQTHDVPQPVFVAEHFGERLLHLRAEQEVLRAGLGFAVGAAAARTGAVQGGRLLPRFQRAVAAHLAGFQVAVGEVQFPVGVFQVAHQVPHAAFEIGQRLIGANAGDHHAVDRVAERRPRTGRRSADRRCGCIARRCLATTDG